MQVYKIEPTYSYSYGCALIAANSEEEAISIYRNSSDYNDYIYKQYDCTCIIVYKLTYDCVEPTVILDTIGAE